jgi:hypothetical protein
MPRERYLALGGHAGAVRPLADVLRSGGEYAVAGRLVRGGGP